MTTDLVTLERELTRLASDFATQLIKVALQARVADLGAFRAEYTLQPEAFPIALRTPRPAPIPVRVAAVAAPPPAPAARAVRARVPSAPRPAPPRLARGAPSFAIAFVDEPEEGDTMENMITDPSSLLDVLASAPPSSERHERERASRSTTGLLSQAGDEEPSAGRGPVLRPGERVQRTAGGNVVLRRGRN